MNSGFILLHRKIVTSDIYKLSPLYLRIFERLLLEANHKDNTIPYQDRKTKVYSKKLIKRGERMTSLRQIAEWVSWYERGILKIPNTKTIKTVLDWLVSNEMIKIKDLNESNRNETHYIIVNYESYQGEQLSKVTVKKQSLDTNNNDNNDKKKYIEKSYLHSVVTLFSVITNKNNEISYCYQIINKLLKLKVSDSISYLQKCLMLMLVICRYKDRINETKYIGILTNQYRELSYLDFKTQVFETFGNPGADISKLETFN